MNSSEKNIALKLFQVIERILLFIVVVMTLVGVFVEIRSLYLAQTLDLGDILLMFLYMEVIGMVAVFYSNRRSASVFPIFIAITALARLIILQGKDMAPENILYEAVAILILSVAAWVLTRFNQTRPDD
ncbi:phosphate-starvation-inducible protein PsiE [Marinobacter sp.]|uniref:phosphate-starvation-inducible protein PsiE n=1 Tax=Marinobacter sp. TaxID=50741 RepID=UPI0035C6CBC2